MWNREGYWVEARQGCLSLMWKMTGSRPGPDLTWVEDEIEIEIEIEVRRKWTRLMERERPT